MSQNADEALQRLHAVANAPINSVFVNQLGLGIVGGRLYPSAGDGIEAAKMAVKILNGTLVFSRIFIRYPAIAISCRILRLQFNGFIKILKSAFVLA